LVRAAVLSTAGPEFKSQWEHFVMHYIQPDLCNSIRVASFDVGLKNLSVCAIDFNQKDFDIRKWSNISIRGKNISDYTIDLVDKLRTHSFGCLDYVLIEQQINRNTQMKVISHILQSYFLCELKIPPSRVIFVSPKKRLDTSCPIHAAIVKAAKEELNIDEAYNRREYKNISVAITRQYLMGDKNSVWRDFFNSQAKKDDYADSFLQAIAWNSSTSIMDID
tara:strand:- start:1110 stop:1772 length:663 start_codon:yes stop_codon:yes gene_type:complete